MKTALLAFTMVGALAGTTLNTVAQDPNDDQVIQELRDERATLAAELAELESMLEVTLQERLQGEDQLNALESKLADVSAHREAVEHEIHALRSALEESMMERDMAARQADEMQRMVEAEIAAMEREIVEREMHMERERAEMELDQVRQELDMERALLERRLIETEAAAAEGRMQSRATADAAPSGTGITIIMNGGDLHIHGSTDHVNVQTPGSH